MKNKAFLAFMLVFSLLASLFIPMPGETVKVNADGENRVLIQGKGDQPTTNPFPDVISQEEIEEETARQRNAGWPDNLGWFYKFVYQPNGGEAKVYTYAELSNSNQETFKSGGKLYIYAVLLGEFPNEVTKAWSYLKFTNSGSSISYEKQPNGELTYNDKDFSIAMELNGQEKITFEQKATVAGLDYKEVSHNQYIKWTMLVPVNTASISLWFGVTGASSSCWATNSPTLFQTKELSTDVFHFVMDDEFRNITKIDAKDSIPGRNSGLSGYTGKASLPIEGLDKNELKVHKTSSAFTYYKADPKYLFKGTFVRPSGELPTGNPGDLSKLMYAYYETDPATAELLTKDDGSYVPRLTFQELTNLVEKDGQLLYVDDDCDWPAASKNQVLDGKDPTQNGTDIGNHIIAPGFDDQGQLHFERHYYVTFGVAPVPVQIKKVAKGADPEKTLAGAKFDLYRKAKADGEQDELLLKDLETNKEGIVNIGTARTEEEIRAVVKDRAGYDKAKKIYVHDGQTYLTPGEYYIKETKAPDGYQEIKEAIPFTIDRVTLTDGKVKVIEVKVEDELLPPTPEQPNEPAQPTCNWCPQPRNPQLYMQQPSQNVTATNAEVPSQPAPQKTLPKTGEGASELPLILALSGLLATAVLVFLKRHA